MANWLSWRAGRLWWTLTRKNQWWRDHPPERLRALLVAEAELGGRIMRALILRRVGLLETGAGGPVIVGRAENGDVIRLEGFLSRNGHPHQRLNPIPIPIQRRRRWSNASRSTPSVADCALPGWTIAAQSSETELAVVLGL